jgi:hypothetical protein
MIGYDLNKPGQNYANLFEAIQKIGNWWHCLDSTWIVKSSSSAVQIRDYLQSHIDKSDELIIVELSGVAAWTGFDETCSSWLKNNL